MKTPKSIMVLSEEYKIKLVDGLMERDQLEGYVDPHSFTIYLDKSLQKNQRAFWRTYWHEVGHAFAMESGLHEVLSAQAIEMFCQNFSAVMIQSKNKR